jgi:hypothetical protein
MTKTMVVADRPDDMARYLSPFGIAEKPYDLLEILLRVRGYSCYIDPVHFTDRCGGAIGVYKGQVLTNGEAIDEH